MSDIKIIDTNSDNILKFGICGYKNVKRPGFLEKVGWVKERLAEGLKIKTLLTAEDGTQGMIEYIPGEYCWRPVEATGYTFIHCIFSGTGSGWKGPRRSLQATRLSIEIVDIMPVFELCVETNC